MSLSKNSIHIVTQAKGGVGKSFISRILIQYLREHMKVFCFDADPLNDGLVAFKGLEAHKLGLKMLNGNFDSRSYYDPLFETILLNDCCFLIDSGASTHINFISYLKGSDILNLFKENDREIIFHIPLSGSVDFNDCYKELLKLSEMLPNNKIVIWENSFNGEVDISYRSEDKFKTMTNIQGIVELENLQAAPLLYDLELMHKQNLIFSEVDANPSYFGAIIRRRLSLYKQSIYTQLDKVFNIQN
jgi:hypothetical protein